MDIYLLSYMNNACKLPVITTLYLFKIIGLVTQCTQLFGIDPKQFLQS